MIKNENKISVRIRTMNSAASDKKEKNIEISNDNVSSKFLGLKTNNSSFV
jgi:hypothetical protein